MHSLPIGLHGVVCTTGTNLLSISMLHFLNEYHMLSFGALTPFYQNIRHNIRGNNNPFKNFFFFIGSTALVGPGRFLVSWPIHNGRTPWTCDQPVARPLPKHRTAQTQNKHIYYTLNIYAQGGIRNRNHGLRAIETVHASDRSFTATGYKNFTKWNFLSQSRLVPLRG
jgi:hypothetical protein